MNIEIEYCGENIEVSGNYFPEEEMTSYYSGYPAEFEIDAIFYEGVDIFPFLENQLDDVEFKVLEKIRDNE